jgi:hypothetical protein
LLSTAYHSIHCEETFFTVVFAPLAASEEPSGHKLSGTPDFPPSRGPHGALFQYLLPFLLLPHDSDELVDFSFVAVSTNLAQTFLYLGFSSEALSQILYSY